MRARRQSPASLFVGLIGVAGFASMMILSLGHPAFAVFLQVSAVVWLLGFGVARLVVEVTESDQASAEDDALAQRAFDFTRDHR
jgi:hypothetical protein